MTEFKSYRDLEVWQKSMVLAKQVYLITSKFPAGERFGLVNQMRRAVVSIPSNLAEGHARAGRAEFKHFISIALGSVAELETQIILSSELGYLNENDRLEFLGRLDIIGIVSQNVKKIYVF